MRDKVSRVEILAGHAGRLFLGWVGVGWVGLQKLRWVLGWVGLDGLLGWVWVGCAPENFGLGWVRQTDPMQDLGPD